MIIRNKLQRQTINHRCKGAHKFRRFSKNNKTFYTDRYYCANCGFTVEIAKVFGHESICWECGNVFNIGYGLKMKPTCPACSNKKEMNKTLPIDQDWMEESGKQVAPQKTIGEMVDMLLEEVVNKKSS